MRDMEDEDIGRFFDEIEEEIMSQQQVLHPATDAVRVALNEAIQKYNLSAASTLVLLARFAAATIHKLQKQLPDPKFKDDIEDMFNDTLVTYLALLDMRDVSEEYNNIRREKMN